MIVAVTGGTGFIGKHLVKQLLLAGHHVRILSRQKVCAPLQGVTYYHGDIRFSNQLDAFVAGVEVVCHCAGEMNQSDALMATNFEGTKNLFLLCHHHKVRRFVHLSSVGVYGDLASGVIDETFPMLAMNQYESSKILADEWLLNQSHLDVQISILRPSNVFASDMPNQSLRELISMIKKRLFFYVGQKSIASYIHVDEVVCALSLMIESDSGSHHSVFNLSDAIVWHQLVKLVCSALSIRRCFPTFSKSTAMFISKFLQTTLGYKNPLKLSRVMAMSKTTVYDSAKIVRELRYKKTSTLAKQLSSFATSLYGLQYEQEELLSLCRVASTSFFLFSQLLGQLHYLKDKGVNLTLISSPGPELKFFSYDNRLKYLPVEIEREINVFKDFKSLMKLIKVFKKNNFQIIHSSTPKAGLLCSIAGLLARVPVRLHTYTGLVWINEKGFKRLIVKFCDRLIAILDTAVYADSQSQAQLLYDQRIVKKTCTVTVLGQGSLSGVNLERFNLQKKTERRTEIRQLLSIPKDAFVFVFMGRVKEEKGIMTLLQAYQKISDVTEQQYRLLICGPMELMTASAQGEFEVCLQQNQSILYVGQIDNPEHYFSASDMLVLPSQREGFGTVVIEAAALKLPTLGTRIPGLIDAIQDGLTGLLVERDNPDELAVKMKEIVDDRELLFRLCEAAYERTIKYFTEAYVASLQIEEYKKQLQLVSPAEVYL